LLSVFQTFPSFSRPPLNGFPAPHRFSFHFLPSSKFPPQPFLRDRFFPQLSESEGVLNVSPFAPVSLLLVRFHMPPSGSLSLAPSPVSDCPFIVTVLVPGGFFSPFLFFSSPAKLLHVALNSEKGGFFPLRIGHPPPDVPFAFPLK